jgi:hypothetical protein
MVSYVFYATDFACQYNLPTIRPHAQTSRRFLKRPYSSPWLKKIINLEIWTGKCDLQLSVATTGTSNQITFFEQDLPTDILSNILFWHIS